MLLRASLLTLTLLILGASLGPTTYASEPIAGRNLESLGSDGEVIRYRWRLGSLLGSLAGIFLPSEGDGILSLKPTGAGSLESELLITSEKADGGEYWRYGSRIDRRSGNALEAWSSYRWRGEEKKKREAIKEADVVDVASGIFQLRKDPPEASRRMEIWSDGKIYQVVVVPLGDETVKLGSGKVRARHLSIRGLDLEKERRWKGKLDLWLAYDAAATPVKIVIERNLASVRLEMTSGDG